MQEPTTCSICLEKFTSTVRAKVKCPFCPSTNCKTCLQKYLLSTPEDAHCFSCKREWNREFLDITFTPTFRKGPLKQHRRTVLVDREMAMLPSMQVYVEATVLRDKHLKEYRKFNQEAEKLNVEKLRAERAFYQSANTDEYENHIEHLCSLSVEHTRSGYKARMHYTIYNQHVAFLEGRETGAARMPVRQFVMKCPGMSENGTDPCRGFLSSQWKCGTCQKYFCNECHVLVGEDKDTPHTCRDEDKANAAFIKKETRPCPKCGVRISKIDGCDQMWCIACQTAFSWNTGAIVNNTRIHNPHYYEYLRQNGRALPREPGDIPCGGLPDYYIFIRAVRLTARLRQDEVEKLFMIHRSLADLTDVRLPDYPLRRPANDNRDLDIAYLIGTITKEEWARHLELKETKFDRRRNIGLILQTLAHVGAEKMTEIQNLSQQNAIEPIRHALEELEHLRVFTNKALVEKGDQMGIVVPQFAAEDWRWGMTRRKIAAVQEAVPVPVPVENPTQ